MYVCETAGHIHLSLICNKYPTHGAVHGLTITPKVESSKGPIYIFKKPETFETMENRIFLNKASKQADRPPHSCRSYTEFASDRVMCVCSIWSTMYTDHLQKPWCMWSMCNSAHSICIWAVWASHPGTATIRVTAKPLWRYKHISIGHQYHIIITDYHHQRHYFALQQINSMSHFKIALRELHSYTL